ncbi:zinc-dependent peptidase [Thiohalocapsa marina]|uniref:Zinc-dependent peptidase n=1 Tax=Thiohalocapsa marina TaxID=424902 RepID=A0A5M8FSF4_9GAMM|nr:M90 family metallopeptidase [Thiohalocapsa marina]KAA6186595.1 zinc-dependent peptidase [Thiohalocapsa marina]
MTKTRFAPTSPTVNPVTRWWQARRLRRALAGVDAALWPRIIAELPLLQGLDDTELARLCDLAALFLQDKSLEPARGACLSIPMRQGLALQACLPVLALGLGRYRGWHALILYPDEFVPAREVIDEDGIVWIDDAPKSGEAWEQGPVILSLADVAAGQQRDGYNVVIHELAHKLDMDNGVANGHPALHADMSNRQWASDLGAAYDDLCRRVDAADQGRGPEPAIDPYASESPAEFFAVCSEAFFELPHLLQGVYPDVYRQFRAFYRQDPAARLPPVDPPPGRVEQTQPFHQ